MTVAVQDDRSGKVGEIQKAAPHDIASPLKQGEALPVVKKRCMYKKDLMTL
jgi:hypothetical protein